MSVKMYSKCRTCGRTYHIAGLCDCKMSEYWKRLAYYHRQEAEACEKRAKSYEDELAKEVKA